MLNAKKGKQTDRPFLKYWLSVLTYRLILVTRNYPTILFHALKKRCWSCLDKMECIISVQVKLLFFRSVMSDLFIILCLILCPVISLWSGVSYIRERRKRRYVFRSRR
ncbi:small membrane protein [Klebsiella quasipneumoniae]|uniref:small membrane protein n=1 Tax=Klebsiella quasipneumoniae TaxID=1463165 RepID=UPI003F8AF1BE